MKGVFWTDSCLTLFPKIQFFALMIDSSDPQQAGTKVGQEFGGEFSKGWMRVFQERVS